MLIFTRTKHGARKLVRQLALAGTLATELHGNLTQAATRNLAAFASGEVRAMVATDIAARGIHVDGIELVVHADPPTEHKAYTHRSGRTARAGPRASWSPCRHRGAGGRGPHPTRKAGVSPRTALACPAPPCCARSPPPAKRVLRAAAPARSATATVSAAAGGQPPSRGAAAASASFRGRRGRR